MRGAVLAVVACSSEPVARPDAACVPGLVYLNRTGGSYDVGPVDDAVANRSVLLDGPRVLAPWPHDDVDWASEARCIRDTLARFPIAITETDPGAVPHVEIVFTTTYWAGPPATTHVVPDGCRPGNELEFVFGAAIATDARACHLALLGFAQMTAGLSLVADCRDVLDLSMDCVPMREFLDATLPCVDGACRCGGTVQSSAAALAAAFPRCE